jgi:hypothetical protein
VASLLSNGERDASAAAPDPAPARPSATRGALALRAEHAAELLGAFAAGLDGVVLTAEQRRDLARAFDRVHDGVAQVAVVLGHAPRPRAFPAEARVETTGYAWAVPPTETP